jgi:hypothetical protein
MLGREREQHLRHRQAHRPAPRPAATPTKITGKSII